jgi:hypothetical protein
MHGVLDDGGVGWTSSLALKGYTFSLLNPGALSFAAIWFYSFLWFFLSFRAIHDKAKMESLSS